MTRPANPHARHLALTVFMLTGITLLAACIVTPKTIDDVQHRDCRLVTRKWELETSVVGAGACINEACVAALLALPVVSGAISGSIVLVGNTLHWLEAQGRCSETDIAVAEYSIANVRPEESTGDPE